jgi:threonine dehydrogenase-like Zn-dependent dehydrogenase
MNSDKFKGVVEIEVLGEQRGFKFGMAAMVMMCKLEGKDLNGVQESLNNGELPTFINLMYAAAVQYAKLYKKPEPSFEEVANWLDHLDGKENEIIKTAFQQSESPNPVAP